MTLPNAKASFNLCYVKITTFNIMGLTDFFESCDGGQYLQPPNIFRFSLLLCLNGQQLLRSERSVFLYIYIEAPLHSPYNSFPYFQISIASFTYFMTMPHTHVIYAPLYAHASHTCHIVKMLLCEFELVMLIYCIRMHIILLCEQCR